MQNSSGMNVCKMKSSDLDLVQDHIQTTSSYAKKIDSSQVSLLLGICLKIESRRMAFITRNHIARMITNKNIKQIVNSVPSSTRALQSHSFNLGVSVNRKKKKKRLKKTKPENKRIQNKSKSTLRINHMHPTMFFNVITEDISPWRYSKAPGHSPGQLSLGGPAVVEGLDQMSSRGPFQPQTLVRLVQEESI